MKQKIFALLVLVMTVMTASAASVYQLTVGTNAHGTVAFKVDGSNATSAQEGQTVTVEITPDANWSTGTIQGQWYAAEARAPRRAAGDIDLLKDFELTPVEGNANAYTFTMKRANAEISVTYKKLLTHNDISIGSIADLTYTGQAQQPAVTVQDGSAVLTLDQDYTVAYSDNTAAGTATVTITAVATSNDYAGQTTTTFTIVKADITPTAPTALELTYAGQAQALISAGSFEGAGNLEQCRMQYSLDGQNWSTTLPQGTDAGDYTVYYRVVGDANHNDVAAQTLTVTIQKAAATVTAPTALELTYAGQAQTLISAGSAEGGEIQYSLDGQNWSTTLPQGTDAGDYTVYYRVVGDANHNDVAAQTLTVTIQKATLTSVTLVETTFVYTQQSQTAQVSAVTAGVLTVPADSYDVEGSTAVVVGQYTVTVTGKGNYQGQSTAQYSIVPANANLFALTVVPEEYVYDGTPKEPAVTVKDGSAVLTEGTDYTLAYENNVNAGTATVTATGKGNYTGTQVKTFEIKKADITPTAPTALELTYNGQAQALISAGSAEGGEMQYSLDGQSWVTTLPQGTDAGGYTVSYRVVGDANHNDVAAQTLQMTIVQAELTAASLKETIFLCNEQEQTAEVSTVSASELTVPATDYEVAGNSATEVGTYTVTVTGKGNFTGEVTAEFAILRDMSKVFADGNGWATYVAREDLALPDGVTAYVVTGATATVVKAEAIQYIPKGVGILLNLFNAINALKEIDWFRLSVRDIRDYRVEEWSDFTESVKKG